MNERLLQVFLGELDEHVGALNRDLLRLEKAGDDPDVLKTLFRTAHSLKGAARALELGEIETVSHHLEEIFGALRDGPLRVDGALIQTLLLAADALADGSRRLRAGEALPAGPLPALPDMLAAAVKQGSARAQLAGRDAPPASRMPAAKAEPAKAVPPAEAPAAPERRLPADLRLASAKLDGILARSAELAIARHRVDRDARLLDDIHGEVQRQRTSWNRFARQLEQIDELASHPVLARLVRDARTEAAGLRQVVQRTRRIGSELAGNLEELGRAGVALDEDVQRVRLVPFATICEGFERLVRDVAIQSGKQAQLSVEGGEVEIDRAVLEGLRDPLQHLVQNAVFHGIETAEQRKASGKDPGGHIELAATLRGERVEISIADDGRGLDLPAIREAARGRGLPESEDDASLVRSIFVAGLTTAKTVNPVAGRGVGLDIVQASVRALRGSVDVASTPGRSTRFTLSLPLTLTSLRAVLVEAGGHHLGIDGASVVRLLRPREADLHRAGDRALLAFEGTALPVACLADLLGVGNDAGAAGPFAVVATGNGGQRAAFLVDALLAEQKVTIQPLGARLESVGPYGGAAILPGGEVVPILDMTQLVARALSQTARAQATPTESGRVRLLVADDSVTVRTLQKNVLEAAGYEVAVATNGGEAWRMLQEQGADLLVSDIEMPELDGFSLTETIRASGRFRDLPVILVTTRSSDEDKARGLRAGADAYLIKSAYDQNELLDTIRQLI